MGLKQLPYFLAMQVTGWETVRDWAEGKTDQEEEEEREEHEDLCEDRVEQCKSGKSCDFQ